MEVKLTVFALLFSFVISALIGPVFIPILRRLKFGQNIRKEGPKSHYAKAGTPTIGGVIFITGTIASVLILGILGKVNISDKSIIMLLVFLGFGFIGFLDDILKIVRKKNEGLTSSQKLIGQFIIALGFFLIFRLVGDNEPTLWISTLKIRVNLGWFYGIFILIMLIGTSNAVNLTDGLDGLAGGLSAIAFFAYGLIAWRAEIAGHEELAVFAFSIVGSLLGFLIYNSHPAKIFMGDTGSLALGGALATIAILVRHELTLIIVGGVFVLETLSVIIQVISYKLTKRRVFLMSPLHHHFEMLGWTEAEIVRSFMMVGFILALLAIAFGAWL